MTSGPAEAVTPAQQVAPGAPGERTRVVARNAAVIAVAEIAGKVATLAFMVAAARVLGQSDFGAFSYALSFSLLLATLPSWGFDSLVVARGGADPAALPRLASEALALRTAIVVPVFLVASVAGALLRPSRDSAIAFVVVLAAAMVDLYCDAGRAAAGARQEQRGVALALVVQRVAMAVLAIGALAAGLGLVGLSVAFLAGTVLGAVLTLAAVRRLDVRPSLSLLTRAGLATTARLSIATGINAFLAMALFRVDQVILQAIKGDDAVGVYAAAYRLVEVVMFLAWSVSRAVFPAMSAARDTRQVARGVEKGTAALATIYIPFGVGLGLLAEPLLRLLYGDPYATAGAPAARWLAGGPLVFAVGYLFTYALISRGRTVQAAAGTAVATVYNVTANLLLIPSMSGTGAALVTTTSYVVLVVALGAFVVPDIGWVRLDRALAVPLAASAVMAGVLLLSPLPVLPEIGLGAAVYVAAWLALARRAAPDHIALIRSLLPGRG